MENGILQGTKKALGLAETYTVFDFDIATYINSAFATLHQLGVGPTAGFTLDAEAATEQTWDDYTLTPANDSMLNLIKTYVILKSKGFFDPPSTSFHLEAFNRQIAELEYRISHYREDALWTTTP